MCGRAILLLSVRALKGKAMEEVARAMWNVITEYGTMKILQSDNGPEFVNTVMKALADMYGIDRRFITPYNPRANGTVERKNKEVSRMLKKYFEGAFDEWQSWVPAVQLALNTKYND